MAAGSHLRVYSDCSATGPVEAVLVGESFDGEGIQGSDTLRLVGAFRGCGLGTGLALLLPALIWLYRRRGRRR